MRLIMTMGYGALTSISAFNAGVMQPIQATLCVRTLMPWKPLLEAVYVFYLLQHFFTGIPSLAVVFAGSLCSCAVDLFSAFLVDLLGGSTSVVDVYCPCCGGTLYCFLLIFSPTLFFYRTPSTVLPA